ncbi:ABC transporter ATP-binding protein [Kribbia dieselivorans]|uniref:ABC transporter ATP-binding protein n=1 Tax=Kribbia dieselivorans TaxID=331526 RepID=UPI000837CA9A|nr:ABC transporter ATP-binding protein [Kribbia dieselivorans]
MLVRLLRRFLRPDSGLLTLLVVLQVASTVATLYLPSLNARIIDEGVVQGDTGFIMRTGTWMLAVSLLQVLATIGATWIAARSTALMAVRLRAAVFSRVGDFSAQEVARFGAPTLISRATNDVLQVQQVGFMGAAMLLPAPMMMAGGVFMALREDPGLSLLLVVAVPLLGLVVGVAISRMVPQFRSMQTSVDTVNRILREQITGIRVVRAFVRERTEQERFGEANTRYTNTSLAVGRLMALTFPTVMFIVNASTVALMWFGAKRIETGHLQVGQLVAFLTYLMLIFMSVMMATFMSMMIPRAAVSAGRIDEVLSTDSSVVDPEQPREIPAGPVTVALSGVDFCYPGAEHSVLHDITFTARPGETTAIIGATGSGKTTLVNLIPRLYDVTDGAVTFNGVDLREAALGKVWAHCGLVPQKALLFTGTIGSNLRLGRPEATDGELWEALRIAQGEDFVRAMPDGLDSAVAQGGTNVSGGQRQRLAIARAIVARPDVYLFDDAFSALDTATDARLRAALRPATRDATVIVVAQRVSTILEADQIVVLEAGRVVGIGTHRELLAGCETYREIVESQQADDQSRPEVSA